ncbi:MAG: M56 family metallopeptidase [Lachnospiraceae bacterium]|nr:M56 family metallopeptidase [Lachnospiraceae bacterium]
MNEFFLKILNMSISASWIILVVLVLRLLLKKAPKWINVLLWGIVAVRLICPFTIESAMSLMPSVDILPPALIDTLQNTTNTTQDITNTSQTTIGTSQDITDPLQNNLGTPTVDETHPQINNSHTPVIQEATATSAKDESIDYIQLFTSIFSKLWIIGVALMLTYSIISYIRIKKKINTAVLLRNNIYQSEVVVSPFVLGIIQPKIYLPFNVSEQNITPIIAHEQAHIKRKDYLWKPIGFLLLTLHWFNPLVWLGYILLCRDIELACDEKAIKEMTIAQRADYSQALLTCSVNRRMITACPIAFGEVNVKNRIKTVLNYKKPTFWIILVAIIASVIVAICFLTNPVSKKKSTDNKKTTTENETEEETEEETKENNNSNSSSAEDASKDINKLKAKFPTYFGLDTTKGLSVYIWQMAEDSYSCGLLANSDIGPTLYEQLQLQETPATLDEMSSIVAYYYPTNAQNHVTIFPIVMPTSSYAYVINSDYTAKIIVLFWRNVREMYPYIVLSTTTEKNTEEQATEETTDKVEPLKPQNMDKSTYEPNGKTPQLLKDVVLSKAEFTFVETELILEENNDYTSKKIAEWPMLLSKFNYRVNYFDDEVLPIDSYCVIDLNEDGYNEILLHHPVGWLILHYEDNKVYGFHYFERGMMPTYSSGMFHGSGGASYGTFSTMSFDKDSFKVTHHAIWDNEKVTIEGKETTQDEYWKYLHSGKFDYMIPDYEDFEDILNID